MGKLSNNLQTALKNPRLAFDYAGWAARKFIGPGVPLREIHGVTLGDFNGFSEYHSASRNVQTEEFAFLMTYPFGDGIVLDVGANLGLFSILVSKRSPSRDIVAFEPNASTFAALERNIERNQAVNVACHQLAVAAHDGVVTFASRENARANASITTMTRPTSDQAIEVSCTTLDSFCATRTTGRIALLKVDVEGFESLVFRGAEKLFSTRRPAVIYFEVCPGLTRAAGFDPAEPARWIADHGYRLHRLGPGGRLEPVEAVAADRVPRVENWVGVDAR
jgi:FkbM family methyltransferase